MDRKKEINAHVHIHSKILESYIRTHTSIQCKNQCTRVNVRSELSLSLTLSVFRSFSLVMVFRFTFYAVVVGGVLAKHKFQVSQEPQTHIR